MKSEQEELAEFIKSSVGAEVLGTIMEGALAVSEKYALRVAKLAQTYYLAYRDAGFTEEQAFALTQQAVINISKPHKT